MCKTLLHLYLLTSIQKAGINLFWEAWLWENTNSSPESQTDSTLLKIFEWPLLPTSKASHFIWVSVITCSALAMLHSLSWCPVSCTFYSWVFHKLLALLTLCLMNLWDPMSARLFLDIRRYSIWSTGKGPRLTSTAWSTPWEWQALARSTGSEVSHCLCRHTGLKDKEDSGVGPTAPVFAVWQVILLSSAFLSAQ